MSYTIIVMLISNNMSIVGAVHTLAVHETVVISMCDAGPGDRGGRAESSSEIPAKKDRL